MYSSMFSQFALILLIQVSSVTTNRTLLFTQLFGNYNKSLRPVCGADATIITKVGIALRQIVDLNEPQQILTVNLWMRLNWFDCQLQWNASEFGGISELTVPSAHVWIPDLTLYDNARVGISGIKDVLAIIHSSGHVICNFPSVLVSLCKVDVTYFPFDTQTCELMFGSWAYNGFELDIINRSATGDMDNFLLNGEWDLVEIRVTRHVVLYNCCPEPYPDVTFFIVLKRKPLFYVVNLLFPCILITAVAVLGFLIPPDSGEKISLEITVLLSIAVFLLIVSENLPPTSETFPFIGIYFCMSIMLVSLSTVLSVVVLNFHFKGEHGRPVPRWMRIVFLEYLAKFLLMSDRTASVSPQIVKEANNSNYKTNLNNVFVKPIANGTSHSQTNKDNSLQDLEFPPGVTGKQFSALSSILRQHLLELQKMNAAADLKNKLENMTSEWMKVAMVMDRLYLLIFVFLQLSITCGVLLKVGMH